MKKQPADARAMVEALKPIFDMMEHGRLKSLQRMQSGWRKIGLTLLVSAAVIIIAIQVNSSSRAAASQNSYRSGALVILLVGGALGALVSAVIYHQWISKHKAVYKSLYKEKVLTGVTQHLQPEMIYSPERGISESAFRNMGLYSGKPDRYQSEDLFAGKIGKTSLMFSEAHAEDKRTSTDSKGHTTTHWVTIFKGLLVVADFNKHFSSWLTIRPDVAEMSFGWLGRKLQGLNSDLIRLENPDFERAFVVHGGDQVEARYLLTPDMQERLLDLRQWFGDDIRVAIHDTHFHLSIPNSDNWFEPDIKRPAHDHSQLQNFILQMTSVFRMVELLDLNTRIWTKD